MFEFAAGPVFHSLVLVDEINRAPPKVQSALLEAMAERQATIAGETRALPDPFMPIATQNPIEHEGTFPLPEAQLDRFMLHAELALPDAATERRILDLEEMEESREPPAAPACLTAAETGAARRAAKAMFLSAAVKDYIVRLVTAPRSPDIAPELGAKIEHPASPRRAGARRRRRQESFAAVVDRIARRRDFAVLLIADRFELAPPPGLYPYRTRDGAIGRLCIARVGEEPETDGRQARLQSLGARFLQIDSGRDAQATARALERFDGRSV